MGDNVTITVLTDALHEIKNDKDFGEKLCNAIAGFHQGLRNTISSGSHCNVAEVVEIHHSNDTVLIAVGGNRASVIGMHIGSIHNTLDSQIEILEEMLKNLKQKKGRRGNR